MIWKRLSSAVRELPGTATVGVSSPSMPIGAQLASAPSPAGSSGNDTSTLLDDLIERTKQLVADVRSDRERLEAQYGDDRELGADL